MSKSDMKAIRFKVRYEALDPAYQAAVEHFIGTLEAENQGKEVQRFKQMLATVLTIIVSRGQGEYDEDELAIIEYAFKLVPDQFPCWEEEDDDE